MKRLLIVCLTALLLVSMAGCGKDDLAAPSTRPAPASPITAPPTVPPTATPTQMPAEPPAQTLPVDPLTLVDNESCSFTVKGICENDYTGVGLQVVCVNKGTRELMFSWDSVSVCGYMYDPQWAQAVGPGETVESTVGIDTFTLESYGIFAVDEISFRLHVFDNENWMDEPIVNDLFQIFPTGLSAGTVACPEREKLAEETMIADNGQFSFCILRAAADDGINYTLRCFLENKTDSTLMFSWDGVTLDGYSAAPAWSATVAPGKRAYSYICFPLSELRENGVEEVSSISFNLVVSDYEAWDGGEVMNDAFTYRPVQETPAG